MPCQRLNGLIQHSFAVRISRELRPLYAREEVPDAHRLLQTIFETQGFALGRAEMEAGDTKSDGRRPWDHSALVRCRQTTIEPQTFPYKEEEEDKDLPTPLAWSSDGCGSVLRQEDPWEGFVIGGVERPEETRDKDFLVQPVDSPDAHAGADLSRLLCQLLAHRRSRLFGLPLARETVNVLLPHALLKPKGSGRDGWFVQPALSLFYVYGSRGFRPIFSFSLFLIPSDVSKAGLGAREMSTTEIHESVRNEWPLTTAFNSMKRSAFTVSGPLGGYLAAAGGPAMSSLDIRPATEGWTTGAGEDDPDRQSLTLRTVTEATLFAITLRMMRGNPSLPTARTRQEIGDRVLTALSASRISSVVVVDDTCSGAQSAPEEKPTCSKSDLPRLLADVAQSISRPYRVPRWITSSGPDGYRLDRYFFDTDCYSMAVLPANRCVVTVGDRCAQRKLRSSALLEAGWTAYMVIGAATATGMIRSVFRDISRSNRSKPDSIADIEREAMVELHETYDLEIMTETFRSRYRLLRKRLGITAEYKALSDKLEALYRETSTRFEGRSERRLQLLTWATAILSAVIAVGTLVLIFKGG